MSDSVEPNLYVKFEAEIGRLLAETGRLNAETGKIGIESRKINAETEKIRAEIDKNNDEKRFFPWLQIVFVILGSAGFYALIGASAAYLVTALLHH